MKVLPLDFKTVNPTNEDLGLSPAGNAEAVYGLVLKVANGEKLEPEEAEVAQLAQWPSYVANVKRAQIRACKAELGMFKMQETALAAISDEKLDDVIEAIGMVTDGSSPVEENSNAQLGVMALAEFFGEPDLTAYQTPASADDVKAALENASENAPTTDVHAGAPAAEEVTENATQEEEKSTQAETEEEPAPAVSNLPVNKTNASVEVQQTGGPRFMQAKTLVDFRQEVAENVKKQQNTLEKLDNVIIEGFLHSAALADQSTLPAQTEKEAEQLEVEVAA